MNANHAVDDKFQPRQTDAFVRQAGEVERAIRVADVHHHLQRQIRHVADAGALDAEVEQLGVDIAGVAFGAGDGDILIFLNAIGSITAADHRRDPQLTGDNRRVTGTPAAVGDNRRGFFMIGSQSGSVMSVTSTSPGSMRFISLISWITLTGPAPMRWPMARPSAMICP